MHMYICDHLTYFIHIFMAVPLQVVLTKGSQPIDCAAIFDQLQLLLNNNFPLFQMKNISISLKYFVKES